MKPKFIGNLVVKVVDDDAEGMFELEEPLSFKSVLIAKTITAPKGFQTDFCSVPMIPGIYELLGGKARMSGTLHDYMYSYPHPVHRSMADSILREMLIEQGIQKWQASLFYVAVRAFGWRYWMKKPKQV